MNILFLLLDSHSTIGGIQHFNKNIITVLDQLNDERKTKTMVYSLKDTSSGLKYNNLTFEFENNNRFVFLIRSFLEILRADIVLIGHINLVFPLGLMFLLFSKKKSILFTHGIEVWNRMPWHMRLLLSKITSIVAVSKFTAKRLVEVQDIVPEKISILHNSIQENVIFPTNKYHTQKKYNLKDQDIILLTVCRINSDEKYKGYDKIIELLPRLKAIYPNIKYLLCGKIDELEKERLNTLIKNSTSIDNIILTGYVTNEELSNLYNICNLFLMPSKGEGFGIVFLEALAHGKPVIAGNEDGSVDALLNGKLGLLVNPNNLDEIFNAIVSIMEGRIGEELIDANYLKNQVFKHYSFDIFKKRLENIIFPE